MVREEGERIRKSGPWVRGGGREGKGGERQFDMQKRDLPRPAPPLDGFISSILQESVLSSGLLKMSSPSLVFDFGPMAPWTPHPLMVPPPCCGSG